MLLTPRFASALVYAAELHQQQERKVSGVPYIAHLLRVSGIVLEDGGNEKEAIAAMLHDAVEDQGGSPVLEAIREKFGETVAAIVAGCSDSFARPKTALAAAKARPRGSCPGGRAVRASGRSGRQARQHSIAPP